ncbi:MAG: ABC transporter ATP-binding protein [Treponema sp.]|nr:ABC transporter ATP-binding protein [Treponema sp.]
MTEVEENYIVVEHVNKYFLRGDEKMQILQDVSFSVAKGEMVCIVGASGCGKSTLLRAVAGLDPMYEGRITVDGQPVVKPEKSRGIVFQEHRLFPWMTVRQNIMYGLSKMDKKSKNELVDQHINLVRLNGFENSYPRQLSGGMAQRAGIARALVNNPPVLLLDEPFGALDTFTKINMQKELKRIQKESKTTMLLVTHDIDEAVFLADKVIVFSSRPGKIEATIKVDLPEIEGAYRDRNSIEFLNVRRKIYDLFFEEK